MLDATTSDGQYAFEFLRVDDVRECPEDYSLPADTDFEALSGHGASDSVLAILSPHPDRIPRVWSYHAVVGADQLRDALASRGLLPAAK